MKPFYQTLLLALLLIMTSYAVNGALPKSVLIDKNKRQMMDALGIDDCKSAIKNLIALEELQAKLPQDLVYYVKGKCHYRLGEYKRAIESLERFFNLVDSSHVNYNKALDLYSTIEKDKAAKEKRLAEVKAAEEKRLAEEKAAAKAAEAREKEIRNAKIDKEKRKQERIKKRCDGLDEIIKNCILLNKQFEECRSNVGVSIALMFDDRLQFEREYRDDSQHCWDDAFDTGYIYNCNLISDQFEDYHFGRDEIIDEPYLNNMYETERELDCG